MSSKKKFRNLTLTEYTDQLALKVPVPGGGSAAALTAAVGAGLISMVANYSIAKARTPAVAKKIEHLLAESERLRRRFLQIVDEDAQAYLQVVKVRPSKDVQLKKKARQRAAAVPQELARLCRQAVNLTPYLVKEGNKYLLSDIRVANELLLAAYAGARINVEINQ